MTKKDILEVTAFLAGVLLFIAIPFGFARLSVADQPSSPTMGVETPTYGGKFFYEKVCVEGRVFIHDRKTGALAQLFDDGENGRLHTVRCGK